MQTPRVLRRSLHGTLAVLCALGCDAAEPAAVTAPRWTCPAEWVAYARGGCGPAVLLCAPDGGAAEGACRDVDASRAHAVSDPDGTVGQSVRRLADGTLAGAWPAVNAPNGPPDESWSPDGVPDAAWSPDAGVSACPTDWTRRDDSTCDPHLRSDCPAGAFPLPGGACTSTALRDCLVGDYADVRAESARDPVAHVREGADDAVADGSAAHPYGTISAALSHLGARGWVLLARGAYRDAVTIIGDVHLVGVCAAAVTLTRDAPGDAPIVQVNGGATLDLRGVHLARGGIGVDLRDNARATLRAVSITGAAMAGVMARAGSTASLDDVAIVEGRGLPSGIGGHGVDASARAQVTVSRAHLAANRGYGLVAWDAGTTMTARDVVVRDTGLAMNAGVYGGGVAALRGGHVDIERAVVAGNTFYGVVATGAGSAVSARDAAVTGSVAVDTSTGGAALGYGLLAREGARLDATRVEATGNRTAGAFVTTRGAMTLTDVTVRDTRGTQFDPGAAWTGAGVACAAGGTVHATRTRVTGNDGVGVDAIDAACEVTVDDGVIEGGRALPDGAQGVGAAASQGARLALNRVLVRDARDYGVVAAGVGSQAAVTASAVRGTRPREGAPGGVAVSAQGGAHVTLSRVRVRDTTGIAVMAGVADDAVASALTVDDSVIERTEGPADATELVGTAMSASRGSSAAVRRTVLADAARNGVAVDGATLTLADSVIRGVGTSPGAGVNFALSALGGATVTADRVLVARSRVAVAVSVEGDGSSLALSDGVVRDIAAPSSRDFGGQGITAVRGARLRVARARVASCETLGVSGYSAGTGVTLVDVAVDDTAPGREGDALVGGVGVLLGDGATGAARRVVVTRSHDVGVWCAGAGSSLDLDDAFVMGVDALPDGAFGEGVVAMAGGRVRASRVAVVGAHGFALGAAVSDVNPASPIAGASLTAVDVFARGVSPSTLRGGSPAAAYGLHVGTGCAADVARAVIDTGQWGFFRVGGGLSLRDALVTRQSRGGGASNGGPADALRLDAVTFTEAAVPVARDIQLPEALLPSPPPP